MRTILERGCTDCRDQMIPNQKTNKVNKQFDNCLADGKEAESIVQSLMEENLCDSCDELLIEHNDDGRYDIAVHCDTRSVRLEIKNDKVSVRTGNICLEVTSRGKASGIFGEVYAAEVLVFKSGKTLYFLDSALIKRICSTQYHGQKKGIKYKTDFYSKIVPCGDYQNGVKSSKAFLIPIGMIKRVAFKIISL